MTAPGYGATVERCGDCAACAVFYGEGAGPAPRCGALTIMFPDGTLGTAADPTAAEAAIRARDPEAAIEWLEGTGPEVCHICGCVAAVCECGWKAPAAARVIDGHVAAFAWEAGWPPGVLLPRGRRWQW